MQAFAKTGTEVHERKFYPIDLGIEASTATLENYNTELKPSTSEKRILEKGQSLLSR